MNLHGRDLPARRCNSAMKYTTNLANLQGNSHLEGMRFDKWQEVWYKTAPIDE
jgi:hypothetical protein